MFGYVTVNENELKIRDFRRYRGFYCGLCQSLKTRYGLRGQILLPNDMTFLTILLNGLYELPLKEEDRTCLTHPTKKQHMIGNEITDYAADMGLLLAYYKLLDDRADDGNLAAGALAGRLRRAVNAIDARWPVQSRTVREAIEAQEAFEKAGASDLDGAAAGSGDALGGIFVMKDDEWADLLRRTGFFLGKFVYLMDAYDDLGSDVKKKRYNPWISRMHDVDFDACVENVLTMMMAECAKNFEKLPIVQDADILRNIIYSGVWTRYAAIRKKQAQVAEA